MPTMTWNALPLPVVLTVYPELKREQYFAVNTKNEVFIETLVRYGNRYQADKAAAVNSLFGGENVVDIATPEIPQAEVGVISTG